MRHVALLVEDDADMASELGELLESHGHQHIHVATQEDAKQLVLSGRHFCYVLLDLQIKVRADSSKAHVDAGMNLLGFIRATFPGRNGQDEHSLPILVMSGHAKDKSTAIKSMQDGGNDFLDKPLSDNMPPFREKLLTALRKSGRELHENCETLTRASRNGGNEQACVMTVAPRTTPVPAGPQDRLKLAAMSFDEAPRAGPYPGWDNAAWVYEQLTGQPITGDTLRKAFKKARITPKHDGYRTQIELADLQRVVRNRPRTRE